MKNIEKTEKIELVAPAGSPEALDAAIGAGADAVYLGLKTFNARMRSANFAYAQAEAAIRAVHRLGRKCYVTVNTVFEQREADRMFQLLRYLDAIGPDALIVQDFGVVKMAREHFPQLKLHASTQMNIAGARGANALSRSGISRAVLARELCASEIQETRAGTNVELEVFVHGALCISESGLCLFSSYLGGKSANRGMCTQACRRIYQRTGTESGGYFFSPADLQLIERVPLLAESGVNALKIEGRMKSADYVGTVVSAYRRVIDTLGASPERVAEAMSQSVAALKNDFARTKTLFHFDYSYEALDGGETSGTRAADYLEPDKPGGTGIALGRISRTRGMDAAFQGFIAGGIAVSVGDSIRVHKADDSERRSFKVSSVESAAGGVWVSLPTGFGSGDPVFLIQTKSRRYPAILPHNLDAFRHTPGHEQAPAVMIPLTKQSARSNAKKLPEGFYAAVSTIGDLYVLQSVRPVRALLAYTRKVAAYLADRTKPPLPFVPSEMILVLDPFFPQGMDAALAREVPSLIERGYQSYVVNNMGHLSLFRDTGATLIAGPYLYSFNRFSAAFIAALGLSSFITPLENNRQNVEKTFDPPLRPSVFITVYALPLLFRIRSDLSGLYHFTGFSGSQGEEFSLQSGPEGSYVLPQKPFSLVDKIPFLYEAGFRRFILDFSAPPLKKKAYKDTMAAAKAGTPLSGITRFNWKDGFFSSEVSSS